MRGLVLGEHARAQEVACRAAVDAEHVDRVDADRTVVFVTEVEIAHEHVARERPVVFHELSVAPSPAAQHAAGAVDPRIIRCGERRPIDSLEGEHQRHGLHLFIDAGVLTPDVVACARKRGKIAVVGSIDDDGRGDREVGFAVPGEGNVVDLRSAGGGNAHRPEEIPAQA